MHFHRFGHRTMMRIYNYLGDHKITNSNRKQLCKSIDWKDQKKIVNRNENLTNKLKYYFVKIGKEINQPAPTPQPLSVTSLIFKQMNELKSKQQISKQDIHKFYTKITATAMAKSQKSSAIKYLMGILFKKYSIQQMINNNEIKSLLKDQPFLEIQTILHVINKQKQKQKPDFNSINNLYLQCFDSILPNASDKQKLKCQALLYKYFGKHMIDCNASQKGLEYLEISAQKHRQLILEEYRKLEGKYKDSHKNTDGSPKTQKQKQYQQLTINALRQNIRRLMQSVFETQYFYYQQKRAELTAPNKTQKEKQELILQITVLIRQGMKLKSFVPGIQIFSKYYHKLMQIYYEFEFTLALMNRDSARAKQIKKQMAQFIKQCLQDISESKSQIEIQKEIIKTMFSIKLHLIRTQKGKSNTEIKQQLSNTAIEIFQAGEMPQKSKQRDVVIKILNDFVHKSIK